MEAIRSISLVSPAAAAVIYVIAAATTLIALLRPNRRTAWAFGTAGVVLALVYVVLDIWPRPFPDSVPGFLYAICFGAVFVLFSLLTQRGRRAWLAVVTAIAMANAYLAANLEYQQYPTVGSFHPVPVTVPLTLEQFQAAEQASQAPQLDGREVGALVTLPAAPMRDAVVYVPPAYFHGATLPVLVLMAGNPGKPMDWFTNGQAAQTLDDFQATNHGRAPIVVSADATGSETGNPGCVDGPRLKVATYISQDIPALLHETFRVDPDQSRWTVGGLSYGATCALQVVANHPEAYGSFLSFSGESEPSVGNHRKTVDELFDGDEEAFQAVNAAALLADAAGTSTYRGIAGRFVAGERDAMSTAALPHLNDLARAAGMETTYETVPGAHSYEVWRTALRQNMDFVAQRGGL
ncbi:alpha/beta hydrolase [Corynebacterium sp.]|uniref:alpha/beta hydrolase n=1 Tax=Corynebacterium sp. TaxID=1720 RepID=UPI002A91F998|nr:alpha/beta hydrolase-fold protein [Corynebacterium sp.]MDY5784752.1 alpha/beta hydrolase-fold protein [Corynebacterium sp.]